MIETPVCASPAMIARSTGAAPRHRGSSEGWTLSIGWADSSGSRMRAPKAHTQTAAGSAAAMTATDSGELTSCGWSQLEAVAAGALGHCGSREPAASARVGDRAA